MTGCNCPGWIKYHCRDGIAWDFENEEYRANPPGEACRCGERCCNTGQDLISDGYNEGFMPDRNVCACKWEGS